jgi:hypothetical protein
MICKYKVCDTLRTWLSQSLASLSRLFCSLRKFFTLCRLVIASASKTEIWINPGLRHGCLQCHNPFNTFVYQLIRSAINCQAKVLKVWALPRSLATTYGIIGYFLFLGVLRCFSSPGYRSPILYIQISAIRHNSYKVSPFGHLRFKAWLAAHRSLSQLPTSFIGILRQGILCARLCNFVLI